MIIYDRPDYHNPEVAPYGLDKFNHPLMRVTYRCDFCGNEESFIAEQARGHGPPSEKWAFWHEGDLSMMRSRSAHFCSIFHRAAWIYYTNGGGRPMQIPRQERVALWR